MENGLKINLNNQEKDLLLQDLCARLPAIWSKNFS